MSAEELGMIEAVTGLDSSAALALFLSSNSNVELAIARHFDGPGVPANAVAPPVVEVPKMVLMADDDDFLVDPNLVVKDVKTGTLVPLLGLKVAARVNQTVADVTLSLRFENPSISNPIEAVLQLADEDIIVHDFEVCVGDSIIQGQCMEKQEAFAKYDDAISSGNTAFLAEKKSKRQSFDISSGNLPPGMVCVVNVRYLTKLETVGDKFVFSLPITRTVPPSDLPRANLSSIDDEKNGKLRAQVPDGLNVTVAITQPQRIIDLTCETHQCDIERLDLTGRVTLNQKAVTPRRFEVSIGVSDPTQAFCVTEAVMESKTKLSEAVESSSAVVVGNQAAPLQAHEMPFDFGPQPGMQGVGEPDPYMNQDFTVWKPYALGLSLLPRIQSDLDMSTEVVFMLDCSGSMAGGRMRRAKSALALFLRALPESVRFNILAFGDQHSKLFTAPRLYNDDTLQAATTWLEKIDAKFGGTNLLTPFEDVLSTPLDPAFPTRQVFLLTDGDVKNKDAVLHCVRTHIGEATRIFAFGIGNEVSQALMRGIARFGRGKAEFVESTTPLEAPVMRQVTRAMQPVLTKFEIDWGTLRAPVQLAPLHFPPVFDGERFDFFSFFEAPNGVTSRHEIKIKAFAENQAFEFPAVVDLGASDLELSIQRFAAHSSIRDMELSANRAGLKKNIVDLAVKYHLASKYTSFVAVHVNESQAATGSMIHMDVDNAIEEENSKGGFLVQAGEKLEELGRGVESMIRTSGNFFSRKLESLADGAGTGSVGSRGRALTGGSPRGGNFFGSANSDPTSAFLQESMDSTDGMFSSDNSSGDEDDDMAEFRAAADVGVLSAVNESMETSASSRWSDFGSSVVSKVEGFFGSRQEQQGFVAPPPPPAAAAAGGARAPPAPASFQTQSVPAAPPKPSHTHTGFAAAEREAHPIALRKKSRSKDKKDGDSHRNFSAKASSGAPMKRKSSLDMEPEEKRKESNAMDFDYPMSAPAPAPAESLMFAEPLRSSASMAPSSRSASMSAKSAISPALILKKAETAMDLIVLAKSNGGFLLDASLAALLGKTLKELLDKVPEILNHLPDLWATALVLATLNKNFAATKEEWSLFHDKGRKLLAKTITAQNLNTTVDSLLQSASEAL